MFFFSSSFIHKKLSLSSLHYIVMNVTIFVDLLCYSEGFRISLICQTRYWLIIFRSLQLDPIELTRLGLQFIYKLMTHLRMNFFASQVVQNPSPINIHLICVYLYNINKYTLAKTFIYFECVGQTVRIATHLQY